MRIYFDTSAVNAIADEPSKPTLVRRLAAQHEPLISSLTLTELVSTPSRSRRLKLLLVASSISAIPSASSRRLLLDERDMLRRSLDAFVRGKGEIDYFKSPGNFPELFLLRDPYCVLDKSYTDIMRGWSGGIESRHHSNMSSMRVESLEEIQQFSLVDKEKVQQGRAAFLRYVVNNPPLMSEITAQRLDDPYFAGLNDKVAGRELDVLASLDAWRFDLVSVVIQIYDRLVQASKYGRKSNPGWVDTKQSLYLAAANAFVTGDVKQRNFLRRVARFGRTPRKVWSFRRLKSELGL